MYEEKFEKRMATQRAEFDAAQVFVLALRAVCQTAVVDDDYPQVRSRYDDAKRALIEAFNNNGALAEVLDAREAKVRAETAKRPLTELFKEEEQRMEDADKAQR